MRCSRARRLIPRYVDSALDDSEARELRAHLGECESCRAEESVLRGAMALLEEWPKAEPRRSFLDLHAKLDERGGVPVGGPWLPVPKWAAAGLAALSIAAGVTLGVAGSDSSAAPVPTQQQVASALGLHSFDDVVEASLVHGLPAGEGESR